MAGGPRVTTGADSTQDYRTDPAFMGAITERFGPIVFDLAAHAGNAQHQRYFTPAEFVVTGTLEDLEGKPGELLPLLDKKGKQKKNKDHVEIFRRVVENRDPNAYAYDAFKHSWSALSRQFTDAEGMPGLLWLNCEFNDIGKWADRCRLESEHGANILLLTPVAIANWFRDAILGYADTYFLLNRLCFDGKNPYPKDCMLSHFRPSAFGASSKVEAWDWLKGVTYGEGRWSRVTEPAAKIAT